MKRKYKPLPPKRGTVILRPTYIRQMTRPITQYTEGKLLRHAYYYNGKIVIENLI